MPQNLAQNDTYIVAVSGGVDSVVLLDVLARAGGKKLVVAHVHHGIRAESDAEYAFVQALAAQYGAGFSGAHLHLGADVSEAEARQKRYEFLRQVAKKHNGTLVVAHHQDDVLETIALQLQRGTGWRGVAAMGAPDVWRPLLWHSKAELYTYAKKHQLQWHEDTTNQQSIYARNRIRPKIAALPAAAKNELMALWLAQTLARHTIESELSTLVTNERHFYIMTPAIVAQEVLRTTLLASDIACTRPQIARALLAIKTAKPGAKFSIGPRAFLLFTKTKFTLIKTAN